MKAVISLLGGLVVLAAVAAGAPAQAQYGTTIVRNRARLQIEVEELRCGALEVSTVAWNSPTRRRVSVCNPDVVGTLQAGDILTHVNGQRLCGAASLQNALNRSRDLPPRRVGSKAVITRSTKSISSAMSGRQRRSGGADREVLTDVRGSAGRRKGCCRSSSASSCSRSRARLHGDACVDSLPSASVP
jgi:hypothetical protein